MADCQYYTFLCRKAENLGMTKAEFSRELGMSSEFLKGLGKGNVRGLRRRTRVKVAALIGYQVEEELYSASFERGSQSVRCLLGKQLCSKDTCCHFCKRRGDCENMCQNHPDVCNCTDKR